MDTSEERITVKQLCCNDDDDYVVQKSKKYNGDDKDSDNIWQQISKEKINKNGKISNRHQDGSLKVEIKDENENNNDVNALFQDTRPLHPCNRLRYWIKDNGIVLFLVKQPLHAQNRLRHWTKDNDNALLLDKWPLHPCNRPKPKTKKLEFKAETWSEIPFINRGVPLVTKKLSAQENKIIDHIIKNSPADNDK